jgi:GNAT superfamily N-acetyltransferase
MSYFLFGDSILHVEILRRIVRGKYLPGWNYLEYLSVGGGIFHGSYCLWGSFSQDKFSGGNFPREHPSTRERGVFVRRIFHGRGISVMILRTVIY